MADITTQFFEEKPAWRNTSKGKPNILAFDVGNTTGFAILTTQATFNVGTIEAPNFSDYETVRRIQSLIIQASPCLVVIEDAFMMRDISVVKKLSYRVGSIATIASLNDQDHIRVLATQWQSPMIGKLPRKEGKAASVAKANSIFGLQLKLKDEHIADALMLALWARGPISAPFKRIQ